MKEHASAIQYVESNVDSPLGSVDRGSMIVYRSSPRLANYSSACYDALGPHEFLEIRSILERVASCVGDCDALVYRS